MKGIILAGGSGTRLYPLTVSVSKQLMPIYDKPMIYYPLATLMLANIKDILIITTPEDRDNFINLLGDGSKLGISIQYKVQKTPTGLPEAFVIGEEFINGDSVCLILGDNIFHSDTFINKYLLPSLVNVKNTVFGCYVRDPERYGVVEFDKNNNVISIEEKPSATNNCPSVSSNSKFLTKFSVFSLNSCCLLSQSSWSVIILIS